jgi:hypothetical protein
MDETLSKIEEIITGIERYNRINDSDLIFIVECLKFTRESISKLNYFEEILDIKHKKN